MLERRHRGAIGAPCIGHPTDDPSSRLRPAYAWHCRRWSCSPNSRQPIHLTIQDSPFRAFELLENAVVIFQCRQVDRQDPLLLGQRFDERLLDMQQILLGESTPAFSFAKVSVWATLNVTLMSRPRSSRATLMSLSRPQTATVKRRSGPGSAANAGPSMNPASAVAPVAAALDAAMNCLRLSNAGRSMSFFLPIRVLRL